MTHGKSAGKVECAAIIPFCNRVFEKREINACCDNRGGKLRKRASNPASRPLATLMENVRAEALGEREIPHLAHRPLREAAEYILESLHRPLGVHLLNAETLIEMIEGSHSREIGFAVKQLRNAFSDFRRELMFHLCLEEDALFPLIITVDDSSPLEIIDDLRYQHMILAVKMEAVLTAAIRTTQSKTVCEGRRALCTTMKKLETLLLDHIHLENNLLFPRALREMSSYPTV